MDTRQAEPVVKNGRTDPEDTVYHPPLNSNGHAKHTDPAAARAETVNLGMAAHRMLATATSGGELRQSDAILACQSLAKIAHHMGWRWEDIVNPEDVET